MCTHVVAALYGVGARLDAQPELLFRLRGVNENDLLANAGTALPLGKPAPAAARVLQADDIAVLFGLDRGDGPESARVGTKPQARTLPARKAVVPLSRGSIESGCCEEKP